MFDEDRADGGTGGSLGLLLMDPVMGGVPEQGCHMAKFDPFLSLDCARVEGTGAQSKEEGIKFCTVA